MTARWFHDVFGFEERSYEETREQLCMEGTTLLVPKHGRRFQVGPWECLSAQQLHERLTSTKQQQLPGTAGGLNFQHIVADVTDLHKDPANDGAVIQVGQVLFCAVLALRQVQCARFLADAQSCWGVGRAANMPCRAASYVSYGLRRRRLSLMPWRWWGQTSHQIRASHGKAPEHTVHTAILPSAKRARGCSCGVLQVRI